MVLETVQEDALTVGEMWTDVWEVYQQVGNEVLGTREKEEKVDNWRHMECSRRKNGNRSVLLIPFRKENLRLRRLNIGVYTVRLKGK